jgi:alkanesulfonate monooxygenase SsuD/methylene tetrahydromethanopterin reductase-like flavin-dependent oxidoreductase (luciferase family)
VPGARWNTSVKALNREGGDLSRKMNETARYATECNATSRRSTWSRSCSPGLRRVARSLVYPVANVTSVGHDEAELKRSRRRQPDPEELSRRFAGTVAQVVDKLGQHAKIGAWVYLHVFDPADHTAWR